MSRRQITIDGFIIEKEMDDSTELLEEIRDDDSRDKTYEQSSGSSLSSSSDIQEETTFRRYKILNKENEARDAVVEDEVAFDEDKDAEKFRSRKRLRNEEKWKRNIKKVKVNTGNEYITKSNRKIPKKSVKKACCDDKNCQYQCNSLVSQDTRSLIFKNFYELGNKEKQREFIARCMKKIEPKQNRNQRTKKGKIRANNCAFFFEVNGKYIRVCKDFFKRTLDVSNNTIATIRKKTNSEGFLESEKRGKHNNQKKVSDATKGNIRNHINLFPRIESHYCRSQTKKEYLDGSLNISTMYRLYTEYCKTNNWATAKKCTYEKIFNEEFNIGFFAPKKDQCAVCAQYQNGNDIEKNNMQEKYDTHLQEKEMSRKEKDKDKELSMQENSSLLVCCYDLQAVIPLPCGEISTFFYKSKLNCINFTVYNITDKSGYCYLWHEALAKRGANEIATCIYKFLKNDCRGKDVIFFSDNCVGQHKNKFVLCMYLYCLKTLDINSITHKYLISGHTQNEGDQMHSCIERQKARALRSGPIFIPSQVAMIAKLAKKTGSPYKVYEMTTDEFYDWKKICDEMGVNFSLQEHDNNWNDVKVFRMEKDVENSVFYKTSYTETEYKVMNIRKNPRRKLNINPSLPLAYKTAPKISKLKHQHLLSLCNENHIKKEYQGFFRNLTAE